MSPLRQTLAAVRIMLVLTVLLGVLYPGALWAAGQVLARDGANGSLVRRDGVVVGSRLLGQATTDPARFHPRPSANDYAGDTSGGSNLYASSPDQQKAVAERSTAYAEIAEGRPTADALTASASGLDPHISPEFARAQVARVAAASGIDEATVAGLVQRHTHGRQLGFLGQPTVDVLELNLALEDLR